MEPSSTAATVALSLPELVRKILEFYFGVQYWGDRPASVSAIRLWSNPDAYRHLGEVPPERRQIYASKIRNIEVWDSSKHCNLSALEGLEFPRLKHLMTDVPSIDSFNKHQMKPFCVRLLRTFIYHGERVSTELLELLRDNCPNLKHALLSTYKEQPPTASFAGFIQSMPFLETFIFTTARIASTPPSPTVDGDLLSSLARRSNLVILQLPWPWSRDAAVSATRQLVDVESHREARPFPSLMSLTLSVPSNAMSKLASMLTNLSRLHLVIKTSDGDAIEPLRELVNLTRLQVMFGETVYIPGASLAALATLSKLESLILAPLHPVWINVTSSFSDADLELVASHWPRLHSLVFGIHCAVSGRGFRSLSSHCRELRRWEMSGPLQVDELLSENLGGPPLFPKLEYLRFAGFAGVMYNMNTDRFEARQRDDGVVFFTLFNDVLV
ncbi:hypothetical protein BBK36DRAFT_1165859 [Trichoderma citrinoviride]|uniref:F-box domain-containing protein n=1 Tax=Trichoderma citrinoviride TaxID=58853 RepID=A0A2T4BJV9_9HYPO|nr:hypothetical protein BBK36DRAFT_1165859 [Trichoderma citrinoviride]PTB69607.1 hypothetical protein BBK36DRAFT_1165859 [Trichoderma citrinoviride]